MKNLITTSLFPLFDKFCYLDENGKIVIMLDEHSGLGVNCSSVKVGDEVNMGGIIFVCVEIIRRHSEIKFENKYPIVSDSKLKELGFDGLVNKNICKTILNETLSHNTPFEDILFVSIPKKEDVELISSLNVNYKREFWVIDKLTNILYVAKENDIFSHIRGERYGVRPVIDVESFNGKVGDTIIAFGYKWFCFEKTENRYSRFVCEKEIYSCSYENALSVEEYLQHWLITDYKADFEIK